MELKPQKIKLTPNGFYKDQIEAINAINDFINSPNQLEFTLAGAAGTGKTYLLKWVVNNLCRFAVCPTAPTHKAVRVIEKTLMKKGKTLQSLHGLRPNLDISNFNIASPQFDPRGQAYIRDYRLVIIDECSMITDDMYELNLRRAKEFGTKILYVGDHLQLLPIQKSKSNAKVFRVKNRYVLREIVRQEAGNPLLELFPLIRNDVTKGTNTFVDYVFKNRTKLYEEVGYSLLTELNFNKYIDEYFNLDILKTNLDAVRVLAYTNAAVGKNNQYIRNKLLNNPSDIITIDDVLTSYTTIVDEFNMPIIINSEDYYVNTIRPYINHHDIKTFAVNLQSAYDTRLTQTIQILDHKDEQSLVRYFKILSHLHKEALISTSNNRAKAWNEYYKFKESILTMLSFPLPKANGNQIVKKDIDYGYAITVHKSQGSTFDNVFVDLKDILYWSKEGKSVKRFDKDMINRLIYVSLSRASNKVIMKL